MTTAVRAAARSSAPLLAYVLHKYDWSESSLIVELFTRAQGRLVVVAKGAKRPTSQLRPVLLPFQRLHAQLGKTPADDKGEVQLLRQAEWAGGAPLLGPAALFPGLYLNELLLKLLARQDPHPALFDAYADTLAALAAAPEGDDAPVLRAFELMLLRELGVLPELNLVTLTLQPVDAQAGYTLRGEQGLVASAHDAVPGAQWVQIEAALSHGSAAALRQACAPVAPGLRGPVRSLLQYHLGGARLRTREVWRDVQSLASAFAPPSPP
jgi:DNA repair protein RecO (recombination protein O)